MSDDLTKVIPEQRTVTIKGETIAIRQIKVGKLSAVVRAISPFAHLMPKPGDTPEKNPIDIFSLVMQHTDDVIQLLGIILDKPVEWMNDLEIDELVLLAAEVFEVNLDFFIQKVLPSVSMAMGRLGSALYGKAQALNGQSPSNA